MAASSSVGGADDNEDTSESEGDMVEVMGYDGEEEEVSFAHASVTSAPILRPKGDYLMHSQRDCLVYRLFFFIQICYNFLHMSRFTTMGYLESESIIHVHLY
jgi:hypothetical protein